MKKDKMFNFAYFIEIILILISFLGFWAMCEFNGGAPYNAYNFFYYMRNSAVCFADVVMIITGILIMVATTDKFIKEINTGFFTLKTTRNNYKKYLTKSIFKMHLKALAFLPVINIIVLLFGGYMFGFGEGSNTYMYQEGLKNPALYIAIYIFFSYIFSIVLANLNLIVNYFVKKTNINYIVSFLVFNFISIITNITININVYDIYLLGVQSIWPSSILYSVLYIITTIFVFIIYSKKEKLVLNYGE